MNPGHDLANKYISEELCLPQAIICTNDYMAYGFLYQFAYYGIKISENITIIGTRKTLSYSDSYNISKK